MQSKDYFPLALITVSPSGTQFSWNMLHMGWYRDVIRKMLDYMYLSKLWESKREINYVSILFNFLLVIWITNLPRNSKDTQVKEKKVENRPIWLKLINITSSLKNSINLKVPKVRVVVGKSAICLYWHSFGKSLPNLHLSFGRYTFWSHVFRKGGTPL